MELLPRKDSLLRGHRGVSNVTKIVCFKTKPISGRRSRGRGSRRVVRDGILWSSGRHGTRVGRLEAPSASSACGRWAF
ncbi:hypothetical protein Nepgr_025720 [Nepenthes gracilis]|uniref:Uncharacterized protein n=1 Tax=Nepenthes gracilis TaxID=150966 RepID=A0AAD3XZS1_NEPGR|nr:hypothetical protein Nepgr_025720 [Nepenthes gracilis]